MKYIVHNSYRGHHICPCGSDKRLRKCHGEVLLEFYKNEKLRAILLQDFDNIVEELKNDKKAKKYLKGKTKKICSDINLLHVNVTIEPRDIIEAVGYSAC